MLGHNFRHDLVKKHVAIFGALFTDLQFERLDSTTGVWNQFMVPLTYGPRDKLIEEAHRQYGSSQQAVALTSPRISFVLERMARDSSRQTNPMNKIAMANETHMFNVVPYNYSFGLYIIAKNQTDGNRILEQILAYFAPSLTISMFPVTGDNTYSKDVKVVLEDVSCEDQYEGDLRERRSVLWTLQFVAQGFIIGPVTTGGIIKRIEMNFHRQDGSNPNAIANAAITIQPGMLSNRLVDKSNTPIIDRAGAVLKSKGTSTTDPSLTIPFSSINQTDNWAFITQYDNGL